MAAAPSMAAAIAASMPAPQSAPTPAAPLYEAIPASMSKVVDIEADISIAAVQLDGLVVSKIIKHSRELQGTSAHGLLLGLDFDGTLEISNSFPLPHHFNEDDDKSAKGVAKYQASMLRSLKEVQADDSIVGFYQVTTLGSFFNQSLVETQAIHQDRLRHGGIVIVHDISQTARGNASFRAFRLTKAFLDAFKRNNFSTESLIDHRLTFSSIVEEIPLRVRTNALMSSFLETLSSGSAVAADGKPGSSSAALPPSYSVLNLGGAGVGRNLEQIVEALDAYKTEEGNLGYLQRQIAREKAKAEAYVSKRKEENASRVAQGLAPLPEEDVTRLFKIPPEPSRLESVLLLGRIDAYAKSLEETASAGLVKMYGVRAGGA
ncbi:translation initiation factor 3 subunit 3 [Cristinia sonorae]|uniref:Eukaryotic translation initiation factor 3 subunit H n=1 Tax=Cristinia sonorae TaxID=1940300 RepID=A0A8K0USX3_9AGAR|nr:translation initiation factor 3 subunit 3 [Cristinia sonorae]